MYRYSAIIGRSLHARGGNNERSAYAASANKPEASLWMQAPAVQRYCADVELADLTSEQFNAEGVLFSFISGEGEDGDRK
jgi:hypothetical protein